MIVKRRWRRYARARLYQPKLRYLYAGWFLFGIIPLYI